MKHVSQEIQKLHQRKQILTILVMTMVVSVIWLGVGLFGSQHTTTIDPELTTLSTPLNPTINQAAIDEIEQKRGYLDTELTRFPIYIIVTSPDGREDRAVTLGAEDEKPVPTPSQSNNSTNVGTF